MFGIVGGILSRGRVRDSPTPGPPSNLISSAGTPVYVPLVSGIGNLVLVVDGLGVSEASGLIVELAADDEPVVLTSP